MELQPRAAVAAGVDGVFVEVHEEPQRALSDGPNALRLNLLAPLWQKLEEIHRVVSVVLQSRFAAVLKTAEWISCLKTGALPERDTIYASNQRALARNAA